MGVSRVPFRVWFHDLDLSLHLNNGRYWTMMDLGRTDILLRMGLWRSVLRHRWMPVITAGKIRFRRELRLFTPFNLESRVLCWAETWIVIEHRLISKGSRGQDVTNAVALVRVGLYDRSAKCFVRTQTMMDEMGAGLASPAPSAEVEAFLQAEDAMKRAG